MKDLTLVLDMTPLPLDCQHTTIKFVCSNTGLKRVTPLLGSEGIVPTAVSAESLGVYTPVSSTLSFPPSCPHLTLPHPTPACLLTLGLKPQITGKISPRISDQGSRDLLGAPLVSHLQESVVELLNSQWGQEGLIQKE